MFHCATTLALITAAACSNNDAAKAMPDASTPPGDPTPTYHQVEQLARPAINEALLITEAYNAGYNATAPSFAGVPDATLNAVVTQAKTVLAAIYLGGCLINGLAGVTKDTGVKPAGTPCHAIGGALFTEGTASGVTLTQASKDASLAYATKVFDQFIPDVMRVDVSDVNKPSNYLTLCGDGDSKPLLCGGRFLSDDVVDVTYNYLLNGAINYLAPGDGGPLDKQIIALTSDGVAFSKDSAKNVDSLSKPDATNASQGHPDVSNAFPYSAPPF